MSVLDDIVRVKKAEIGRLHPWRAALRKQAEAAPAPRDFAGSLRVEEVGVIAEVKRRSPSAGWIRRDANAAGLASMYAHGGAAAISVLTDGEHFGGSREDLEQVRSAVETPVLRKDFVLEAVQVHEARAMGADAVLLIVRILSDDVLRDLTALAADLGMAALVETHEEREVERALKAGARGVGINNRDLSRFETDLATTERLVAGIPADVVVVGESGIHDRADVERLAAAGVDAVLVGEALVRADDPQSAVAGLAGVARRARVG